MNFKKYNEDAIRKYLLSHAEIGSFYITCVKGKDSALINYFDSNGGNWCLMEDDDELVSDSVLFLRNNGAPFFDNINAAQEFEKKWQK